MTSNRINILIDKFIFSELAESETQELLTWIEADPANLAAFYEAIEIQQLLHKKGATFDSSEAFAKIEKLLNDSKVKAPKQRGLSSFLKYAAIFIGILGLGYYFLSPFPQENYTDTTPDFVTLEFEDGRVEKIDSIVQKNLVQSNSLLVSDGKKQALSYQNAPKTKEVVYNRLHIPYGKTFQLILSDGTKITLNSGTTLKYPVYFLPNQKREVFLEGEAYFEVAKNPAQQFIVHTKQQDITVYGTKFNVSAYKDERYTRTVLVEGSVGVATATSSLKIVPGEMAVSKKQDHHINVKKVDPYEHIAWVKHELAFINAPFSAITLRLERKYDVRIVNHYDALKQQVFTATFKEKDLEEILRLFSKSRPFEFTKKGNTIIINPL